MGDRKNPIMFGPEWLRNLNPSEPSAGRSTSRPSTRSRAQSSGPESGGQASNASGPNVPTPSTSTRNTNTIPLPLRISRRVKQRYGREELLALCERSGDPPEDLKTFDLLYQAREKKPIALLSFEEEVRENTAQRGGPPAGTQTADRFGGVRGAARAPAVPEPRGRARLPFARHLLPGQPTNRVANTPALTASARSVGFSSGLDEEPSPTRPWCASNGGVLPNRPGEQADWAQSKLFRRRPNNLTNWRQTSRDDSDEWRANEAAGRPQTRSTTDKWDRERNDSDRRPPLERPQLWSNTRRAWVTSDNDENLPEWAIDNTEAGAGTFDSTGAFHGYNNDDSNVPNTSEANYALSRSHTHAGFSRANRTFEEGSEDWWASEKASKLSPKRFETGERKIKKPQANPLELQTTHTTAETTMQDEARALEVPTRDKGRASTSKETKLELSTNKKFPESKSFGGTMRPQTGFEENGERGNYTSVMLNQNNRLRLQHQNITSANNSQQPTALYQLLQNMNSNADQQDNLDDTLLGDLNDLTLTEEDNTQRNIQNQPSSQHQMPENPMLMSNARTMQLHQLASQALYIIQTNNHPVLTSTGMIGVPREHVLMALQNAGLTEQDIPVRIPASALTSDLSGMAPGFNTDPNSAHAVHARTNDTTLSTVGVQSSELNSALGLSVPGANQTNLMYPMRMPGSMPPMLQGQQMTGMGMHPRPVLGAYQNTDNIQNNMGNSSLFMDRSNPPPTLTTQNMQVANQNAQNQFPVGMQQANVDVAADSYYNTAMSHQDHIHSVNNIANLWYYKDPNGKIQGPFTSGEMLRWFDAGYFSLSLMVRRACEHVMRPLGAYGPTVPFIYNIDVPPNQLLSAQEMMALGNGNLADELLWGQPGPSQVAVWAQQRGDDDVNALPPFFWNGPNAGSINLPADIVKEMKTEDQILAQMRAKQNIPAPQQTPPFLNDNAPTTTSSSTTISSTEDSFNVRATPDLEKLHQLIQSETQAPTSESKSQSEESETKYEKPDKTETPAEPVAIKTQPTQKIPSETKPSKQAITEPEKPAKAKDTNNVTKTKTKKGKEEKKDATETKIKEEEVKSEKASVESSPTKSKKEEKLSKKEIEKEKKEWIKEGFTIVKGAEKTNKENKKKAEETKVVEELERKKKEEEKLATEEEKKKKPVDMVTKKQVEQQQRQISESLVKRAPWSVSTQSVASTKAGLTLSEIQRLEREKKLEQIKEQQHMMHLIAQQQAAALAREQEMQANLAWAKNNLANNGAGPSLAEIQAETRRQSAAAAAAATQSIEEVIPLPQLPTNLVPWGTSANGGGFWDTQPAASKSEKPPVSKSEKPPASKSEKPPASKSEKPPASKTEKPPASKTEKPPASKTEKPPASKSEKPQEPVKPVKPAEPKIKKKVTVPNPTNTTAPANPTNATNPANPANPTNTTNPACATNSTAKDENSPKSDFEAWCETVLSLWKAKIDVPTFVGFLRDIESPYEVKDYVKCYLGDSKDSGDFVRQFLERRSKMLRMGMETPSDDLCSPAMAINPRAPLSDYQEVKGKGKKSKKNKMLKVDARILGFSVTASEDRINVGDIDTA